MCHVLVALLEDISIAFFADISIAFFPAKAMAMKSKAAQSKAMKSKAMKSKAMQSKAMKSKAMKSKAMKAMATKSQAMQSKAMQSKAMQSKPKLKRGDIQCSGYTFSDEARRCTRTMFACMAGDAACGWAGEGRDGYGHWCNICFGACDAPCGWSDAAAWAGLNSPAR